MTGSLLLPLAGCARTRAAPLIRQPAWECGRPKALRAEELPALEGGLPFDHPENVDAMMRRHNIIRAHVQAQEAALDCFAAQTRREHGRADH